MRRRNLEAVMEEPMQLEEDMALTQFCERFGVNPTEASEKLRFKSYTITEGKRLLRNLSMVPGEIVEEFKRYFMEAGPLFWNEDEGRARPTYSPAVAEREIPISKNQLSYLMNHGIPKNLVPVSADSAEVTIENNLAKIPSLNLPYNFFPRVPVSAVNVWREYAVKLEVTISRLQREDKAKSRVEDKIASNPEGYPLYSPMDNFIPEQGEKYFHGTYGIFKVLELRPTSKSFPNREYSTFIAEFENGEKRALAYDMKPRKTR